MSYKIWGEKKLKTGPSFIKLQLSFFPSVGVGSTFCGAERLYNFESHFYQHTIIDAKLGTGPKKGLRK